MKLGIFIVLALSCMVFNAHALTFYKLESFLDFKEVFLNVPDNANPAYAWWTPYYATPTNPNWVAPIAEATAYTNTAGALGGQRDQILGFESTSDPGTTASLVSRPANGGVGACYYTLGFVGGGYWQWDGIDNTPGLRPAKANVNPGIGSNTNYVYLPGHAAGGQTIDLTLGGAVKALNFEALTDLDCEYTWDFFDAQNRSAKITIPISNSATYRPYQILFSATASADIDAGWSGYNSIAAIQLVVYTFQSDTNAIDTEFRNLNFVGYQITGNVVSDCDCNTSNGVDRSVSGQPVTLRSGTGTTPTGNLLTTVNTDASGNFVITGTPLNTGSYQVCIEAPLSGLNLCAAQTVCRRVDLNGFTDPAALQFVVQQAQTLTPPGDRSVNCGDCTDATVACTGVATLNSCAGGTTTFSDHNDIITNTQCVRTVTRTFNGGAAGTVTQRITITDNQAPVLRTPASDQAPPCTNLNPTFQQWLNNNGGATWTDCSTITVTNDATGSPANCGSRTVIFTARDPCNTGPTSTTATYSLIDNQAPVFNPEATPGSAPCDVSGGSDFAAFNVWLANNGGARATDNCGTPAITNNYTPGSITRGCNAQTTVVFTATDSCGQTDTTVSTFTITDANGPRITNQATNPSVTCDGTQNTQFQTWLNNHANLVATDSCTASNLLTWDDDFSGTTVPAGCNTPTTVVFTVYDDCRQSTSATGTFTVRDTTAPQITTQPTPLTIPCGSGNSNSLTAWLNDNAGARATDACTTNVAWTNNFGTVIGGNCNSTTVQFTVCDLCATPNCRTVTSSYSIQDQQAPTYLTPPQNANAECNAQSASLYQSWLASGANAVLTDNCSPDNIRFTNNASGPAPSGCFATKTVTFFASDPCGNAAAPRTAAFTVEDNVAPEIQTFASPRTVECNPTLNQNDYQSWLSSHGGAVATDACASTVSWVNNGPTSVSLTTGCSSTVTVNFIVSDGCSNTASTSSTYTIRDTAAPRITQQAQNQASECTDTSANIQSWLNNNGGARATDDCSAITWTNNFIAVSGSCSAGATVTFTARDSCGQSASTVASFTINDTQPPVITTPARSTSVACGPDVPGALATFLNTHGGAVADDACQGDDSLVWTNNFSSAPPGCGFRAVTFTVTDPCNRSAQTTASFTVLDTTAPVWDPEPADLSVECDSDNQIDYNTWLSTRAGSFASDSCAVDLTYSNNAPTNAPQRCASVTVIFTVEDQCNNVLTGTATFAVVDTLAPSFTIPPQDLVVECDGTLSENAMNAWLDDVAGATAVDLCTPENELAYSHSTTQTPVRDVCLSSTIYTFNVVDSCGNTARDTAAFIIRDTRAPVFSVNPTDASFECDGTGNTAQITNWLNTHGGAVAADACQSSVEWTTDYPGAGPTTCQSIRVTFTATDECGFRTSRSATLAVEDTQDPVFTDVPEDVTLPCDALTDPDHIGFPTATDACAGNLIVFYTDSESDLPPVGNCPGNHLILRTFQTVDECANQIEVSQLITVVIARSSGPCDPGDCDCECCPPAAPSQCIAANCRPTDCRAVPCASSVCTCVEDSQTAVVAATNNGVTVRNVEMNDESENQQCKPVYIYVNDDDDDLVKDAAQEAGVSQQRILVTNKLIERFAKSGASSVAPFIFVILSLLFVLF